MMSKECKCKNEYKVSCSDYIGNVNHSPIYMKTIFKTNEIYYYNFIDNIYFVSDTKEHIRHKDYYNAYVEYFSPDEFKKYFIIK